jgi:hypothetical protein
MEYIFWEKIKLIVFPLEIAAILESKINEQKTQ